MLRRIHMKLIPHVVHLFLMFTHAVCLITQRSSPMSRHWMCISPWNAHGHSWAQDWNLYVLGREAGCPCHTLVLNITLLSTWYTQANRNSKIQSLREGNLLIMLLPSTLPEGTPAGVHPHRQGWPIAMATTSYSAISRQGRGRARCVTILTLSASACCISNRCLHPASCK